MEINDLEVEGGLLGVRGRRLVRRGIVCLVLTRILFSRPALLIIVESESQNELLGYFLTHLVVLLWIKCPWVVGIIEESEVSNFAIESVVIKEAIVHHLHFINFLGDDWVRVILRVNAHDVDFVDGHFHPH